MGVWGAGLYSGDFALDLRGTIRAVSALPFDAEDLLTILRDTVDGISDNPNDEEYTTFWLVTADQFLRRGIHSDEVIRTAIGVIDNGIDIAMLRELGMSEPDLKKRAAALVTLRARLDSTPAKPIQRKVMRSQAPYVLEEGGVYRFPSSHGHGINPYFTSQDIARYPSAQFTADGWGALAVVERGRAFDYLPWYRIAVLTHEQLVRPETVPDLRGWRIAGVGTVTRSHKERMRLDQIGHVVINAESLERVLPDRGDGTEAAVQDVSIADCMYMLSVTGPSMMGNIEAVISRSIKIDLLSDLE
jgi:hypothetical protein